MRDGNPRAVESSVRKTGPASDVLKEKLVTTDDGRRHGLERARTSEIGFLIETKRRGIRGTFRGKEAGVPGAISCTFRGNVEGGVEIWEEQKGRR